MTYVKIENQLIPATIQGRTIDSAWGGRDSKAITCNLSYQEVMALFTDGRPWSIVYQAGSYTDPETGETVTPEAVTYDNSDYCVAGDVTDHRDGTITVKMGKLTDLEATLEMIYGGETV